jgi:hypothetical protein
MSEVIPLKRQSRLRTAALVGLLCCVPLAYALARPARVLQFAGGFSCRSDLVCAEGPSRLAEASDLYDGAVGFLASSVTPLQGKPLVVFCSTPSCYSFTGESGSAAKTVGKFIIVVSPRGWKPYILRHEMIHRLQADKLSVFEMFGKPEWYIEGMAYTLSQDPREQLIEPFQSDRARFRTWYATVGKERLWSAPLSP